MINFGTAIALEALFQIECGWVEDGFFSREKWLQAYLLLELIDRSK